MGGNKDFARLSPIRTSVLKYILFGPFITVHKMSYRFTYANCIVRIIRLRGPSAQQARST